MIGKSRSSLRPCLYLETNVHRPLITAATAGAVLAFGLITVPALANASTNSGTGANAVAGAATVAGAARIDRGGDPLAGLAQGTLTADQMTKLAGMAEEEKLAHDVYVKLANSTGDVRFTQVATSETRHVTQIQAMLTRYGIADPTEGMAEGQFASQAVQKLYNDLVARGSVSLDEALAVGRDIETLDIGDLATAAAGVTAQDVVTVYTRLSEGSQNHLRVFGG
jgi:hypothetical protein